MRKTKKLSIMVAIITVFAISLAGCGFGSTKDDTTAKCFNGKFVGQIEKETDVISFKGIPYAKPPTGKLRWKAPVAVEKSDGTFDAKKFGPTSVQSTWHSEPASYENPQGISEDCLTLNVWTSDLKTKNKPIMFYIHGGGYGWGGTADPLYDGQFIVAEHNDVIVVSCNYRVGMFGFADFSKVPGGEDYTNTTYLGVLDLIQGLKWVKQNAEAFGGDPNNITIFGESAGGGLVSNLLVVKEAKGLFNRAIAESGSENFTFPKKTFEERNQIGTLMEITGAKTMEDLINIPEEKMISIYTTPDKDGYTLCDLYGMPMRGDGSIIPEDPYKELLNGASKDVDVLIGTNADEWNYWIGEMINKPIPELTPEELAYAKDLNLNDTTYGQIGSHYAKAMEFEPKAVKKCLALFGEKMTFDKKRTEIANELGFRLPAITTAYNHASAGGKTYMYYFGKEATNYDFFGACHASELAYVFHNPSETDFCGEIDLKLADNICAAWVNFAKTGDPSTDSVEWLPYNASDRNTMMIGNDSTMTMMKDPKGAQRQILEPLVSYYYP